MKEIIIVAPLIRQNLNPNMLSIRFKFGPYVSERLSKKIKRYKPGTKKYLILQSLLAVIEEINEWTKKEEDFEKSKNKEKIERPDFPFNEIHRRLDRKKIFSSIHEKLKNFSEFWENNGV